MRRFFHILLLLSILLVTGCVEPLVHEKPRLYIRVDIPQESITKATVGEESSLSEEQAIKDFQVWVFRHSDEATATPIGYKNFTSGELGLIKKGYADAWYLDLDEAVAKAAPNVDVYALANYKSVKSGTYNGSSTRQSLDAVLLNNFGTASPQASVPGNGLPYSAVKKNIPMTGTFPMLELESVTLTRAVSKVTFLFCQVCVDDEDKTLVEQFSIDNLTLSGGTICSKEYLFNDTGTGIKVNAVSDSDYDQDPIVLTSPELARNPFPQKYSYRPNEYPNETAAEYSSRLKQAVTDGLLTRTVYYLRESDRQLSGTFTYSIGLQTGLTGSFTMNAAGDFSRNHDWIVYIYFLADTIQFEVSAVGWTTGGKFYLTPES